MTELDVAATTTTLNISRIALSQKVVVMPSKRPAHKRKKSKSIYALNE